MPFHDKAVRAADRIRGEPTREVHRGDDREQARPAQVGKVGGEQVAWVETHREVPVGRGRALHPHGQRYRLVTGQPVEQVGQLCRAAGADEHVVHSGQHRPVTGERDRQFDLTQVIDAHHAVVPLLGQEHLDEVRRGRQLL